MITDTRVELRHTPDCPNLDASRALLESCISELGLTLTVIDREGEYPSPTIVVNGADVMGQPLSDSAGCRLDLPTRERILQALRA